MRGGAISRLFVLNFGRYRQDRPKVRDWGGGS